MGYTLYGQKRLNISFRSNYRQALFGLFHLGFVDNNNWYVVSADDRESIKAALEFYQTKIQGLSSFPVYDGKVFYSRPGSDPLVLRQILGLPDEVFSRFDLLKEILPQIRFASGLSVLKRECYLDVYQPLGRKWFTDDFKLYCLTHGFFFLYDETRPFVEKTQPEIPVFLSQERIPTPLQKRIAEAGSERFAIDFLGVSASPEIIAEMRRFDRFSFERRIAYFVDHLFDQEISDLDPSEEFRRQYERILREYFASLINVLYDDYSFEVLNKVTAKLSFMSSSKIHADKDIYVRSSFHADMFSYDDQDYFFSLEDRPRIKALIEEALREKGDGDLLSLYSSLGLPYEGYAFLKKDGPLTVSSLLSALPFRAGISESAAFLSAKRFDMFYSYLSEEDAHRYVFLKRELLDQGIRYISDKPLLLSDPLTVITVEIRKMKRCDSLASLFDEKGKVLSEEILPCYFLSTQDGELSEPDLRKKVSLLDEKSQGEAFQRFFSFFQGISVKEAVDQLLFYYDLESLGTSSLVPFFWFVLRYPLEVAEREYRLSCLQNGDTLSLLALDGLPKINETYEPNLPYPYVTYGKYAYSFRESYFSTPYLCSSEKEAIEKKILYYGNLFDSKKENEKAPLTRKNRFILDHLGLPDNVTSSLRLSKDLFPQLPFKDHICHLCLGSSPSYHENIDHNEAESYNVYLTYLRAQAGEKGVFFEKPLLFGTYGYAFGDFLNEIQNGTYHSVLAFDRKDVDPILFPYVDVNRKSILAIMAAFFSPDFYLGTFSEQVVAFAQLGEEKIRKLLFDCDASLYPLLNRNMEVYSRLLFFFRSAEMAYASYVSSKDVPLTDNGFCMNMDYNPRLPYPYVFLGNYFNAYGSSADAKEMYFCECDRHAMTLLFKENVALLDRWKVPKELQTPLALGLTGLPYLAILRYGDMDLSSLTPDDVIQKIAFRDAICRRCTNTSHSAYLVCFTKAFPFKEDMAADYRFSENGLLHDGIHIIAETEIGSIVYSPSYHYDLTASDDPLLPLVLYFGKEVPEALFTYFVPPKEQLKNRLFDFAAKSPEKAEAVAYASGVILDSYQRNSNVFLDFFNDCGSGKPLRQEITQFFPEIGRVREEYQEATMQSVLGFLTYLIEGLYRKYAEKESPVGR